MLTKINQLLDVLSDYLASRKGVLPLLGILLILANLVVNLLGGTNWLSETDFFLHLGAIVAIFGFMLAWAL